MQRLKWLNIPFARLIIHIIEFNSLKHDKQYTVPQLADTSDSFIIVLPVFNIDRDKKHSN